MSDKIYIKYFSSQFHSMSFEDQLLDLHRLYIIKKRAYKKYNI